MKTESAPATHPIAQNKCTVDSDQLLTRARAAAKLKGITSAEYRLSQARSSQEPVWTLSFFADAADPVARLQAGAKTGAVKILALN
jgi:hypothetical protein